MRKISSLILSFLAISFIACGKVVIDSDPQVDAGSSIGSTAGVGVGGGSSSSSISVGEGGAGGKLSSSSISTTAVSTSSTGMFCNPQMEMCCTEDQFLCYQLCCKDAVLNRAGFIISASECHSNQEQGICCDKDLTCASAK